VSGFKFHVSRVDLFASEEARKKRSLLPENVVDANVHTCLLSKVKQKTLHPLRDEEFSPRYHPDCVIQIFLA
jgi:hypothetical protein